MKVYVVFWEDPRVYDATLARGEFWRPRGVFWVMIETEGSKKGQWRLAWEGAFSNAHGCAAFESREGAERVAKRFIHGGVNG